MFPRLSLYMFEGCAYCERVRLAIRHLDLAVDERDIRSEPDHAEALIEALGNSAVPVLRIEDGDTARLMPESADIVRYLYAEFGEGRRPPLLATDAPQAIGGILALLLFVLSLVIDGPTRLILLGGAAFAYTSRSNLALWIRPRG